MADTKNTGRLYRELFKVSLSIASEYVVPETYESADIGRLARINLASAFFLGAIIGGAVAEIKTER